MICIVHCIVVYIYTYFFGVRSERSSELDLTRSGSVRSELQRFKESRRFNLQTPPTLHVLARAPYKRFNSSSPFTSPTTLSDRIEGLIHIFELCSNISKRSLLESVRVELHQNLPHKMLSAGPISMNVHIGEMFRARVYVCIRTCVSLAATSENAGRTTMPSFDETALWILQRFRRLPRVDSAGLGELQGRVTTCAVCMSGNAGSLVLLSIDKDGRMKSIRPVECRQG